MGGSGFDQYMSDIIACTEPLLFSLGTAFLIGFVYMIVLRLCGGPIIYCSILAMIGGTGYGAYMMYDISEKMDPTEQYQPYYLYGSYGVGGLCALLVLCAICNCKNIRIGVAVMKCTAAFIGGTP